MKYRCLNLDTFFMKTYRIRDHPTLILLIFLAFYFYDSVVGIPIAESFSKNSSICFEKEFYEADYCKKIKN